MVEISNNMINIDTIINTNSNSINTECPICFDVMSDNDPILILDCCFKKVHLSCIIEWYSKRPDNKICFMCNQANNFCKDLIYDTSYSNVIDITETSDSSIVTDNSISIINTYYHHHIIIKIIMMLCITEIVCWILIYFFIKS